MKPHPPNAESTSSRWAVILVRLPEDLSGLMDVLPRSRAVSPEDLPLVTRVTTDLNKAHDTAKRLRQAGAQVVIVEEPVHRGESAFCADHPAQLAAQACMVCQASICPGCMVHAGGERMCVRCFDTRHRAIRRTRRRQLFVGLLFTAFLYQVYSYLRSDAEQIKGDALIQIGIMQFAPKANAGASIIRTLNQGHLGDDSGNSLKNLGRWIDREYERYTGLQGPLVRVTSRGPFSVDLKPPALMKDGDGWWKMMFRAWQYPRYFHAVARDHGLNVDSFGVKVYVVYGSGSGDLARHSRASKTGRIAVVFVSLDETNPAYALATMAHEIGHALGATDTYDPVTSLSVHPTGFVEPFADPLYPQRYAELMAVDIPVAPDAEREIRSLNDLRVGYQSAAEMGWIGPEQARLFYTPPEITPAEKL